MTNINEFLQSLCFPERNISLESKKWSQILRLEFFIYLRIIQRRTDDCKNGILRKNCRSFLLIAAPVLFFLHPSLMIFQKCRIHSMINHKK